MQLLRSTAVAGPDASERPAPARRRGSRVRARSLATRRIRVRTARARRRELEQQYRELTDLGTSALPDPLLISSFAVEDEWDGASQLEPGTAADPDVQNRYFDGFDEQPASSLAVSEHLAVAQNNSMALAFSEAAELLERWDAGPWATPALQKAQDCTDFPAPDVSDAPDAPDAPDEFVAQDEPSAQDDIADVELEHDLLDGEHDGDENLDDIADTAEWQASEWQAPGRPDAIDLSDGPKLIEHPAAPRMGERYRGPVPAQRIPAVQPAGDALSPAHDPHQLNRFGQQPHLEPSAQLEQPAQPDEMLDEPLGEPTGGMPLDLFGDTGTIDALGDAERSALIADVAGFAAGLLPGMPVPHQFSAAHDADGLAGPTADQPAPHATSAYQPDVTQLDALQSTPTEPLLAVVLAAVASLAAWGTMAPASIWLPLAVLPLAGLLALLTPGGDTARLVRATSMLAAASVLPTISSAMTPVTLLVALAVVATYPLLSGPVIGRATTAFAALSLLAPLTAEAFRTGPAAFLSSFFDAQSGALTAVRVSLAAGVVVVALIGLSAMATRRMLISTATAASSRERAARETADRLGLAAVCDEATGLPNRQEFLRRLATELDQHDQNDDASTELRSHRPNPVRPAGLALIEIDRFAMIADSLGAQPADDVATEVGLRLRAGVRAGHLVARISREQFAVLMPDATADACEELARTVMLSLEHPVVTGEHQVPVTCSMGTVMHDPQDGELSTPAQLLQAADEAVRAAQRCGRSQWVMFDQAVRAHTLGQASLEIELAQAVRTGTIDADYQPLLALGTGDEDDRIVGAEALARWTRTDGSSVPPAQFIAMADELGLGVQLGLQMVEMALDALLEWRREGVGVDQVWVNLAPSQLREPDLAHEISARLAVRGLTTSCLVLEVSATTLAATPAALASLSMLRSLGVAIALDDFGRTGTSLTSLRSLPISAVKIDHELARELGTDDAVSRSITQLCHSLGLRVVIEGVETIRQLHGARAIEADAVQGYAIARPMSAQDVTSLLSLRLPREFRLA